MPATVIVGTQWGDEGKGRFTDLLAKEMHARRALPGRPQRRPHARGRRRDASRSSWCPSGVLYDHITPVIGNGVVVDPRVLLAELDMLEAKRRRRQPAQAVGQRPPDPARTTRSIDRVTERHLGKNKLGTTKRGIGPAYADKACPRRPPRAGPARPQDLPREARRWCCGRRTPMLAKVYNRSALDADEIVERVPRRLAPRLEPYDRRHRQPGPRGARGRPARPLRGRAGHVPRPRPRHLSVRDVVEPGGRRRLHRCRAWARCTSTGSSASPRPTSPGSVPGPSRPSCIEGDPIGDDARRARPRVRHQHRSPPAARAGSTPSCSATPCG